MMDGQGGLARFTDSECGLLMSVDDVDVDATGFEHACVLVGSVVSGNVLRNAQCADMPTTGYECQAAGGHMIRNDGET